MRESIEIGGITIKPGESATIDLPIADLSTHAPISMPVQVVHSRHEGPRLFVCAALHGDEINGVEIIRRVLRLSALKRLRGTLIAVPVVNVYGFINLSRYLPDRRDLNRSFPGRARGSLAGRLANLFLNQIVSKCTHGLDLHTAAIHRDNYPQIRANLDDPEVAEIAKEFGVPILINASLREGSLREAAADMNVPVIVYEAGEALRFDEASIRAGVKGVVRTMRAIGMLPKVRNRNKFSPIVARSSIWTRASQSGVLRSAVALGAQVNKGQTLAIIADPFGDNEEAIDAPTDGYVIGRTNLPLVHEGDALFHIVSVTGKQAVARDLDGFEPISEYEKGATAELTDEPPISP